MKRHWFAVSRGVPGSGLCSNQNQSAFLLHSFSKSLASLQLVLNNYLGNWSLSLKQHRSQKKKDSAAVTLPIKKRWMSHQNWVNALWKTLLRKWRGKAQIEKNRLQATYLLRLASEIYKELSEIIRKQTAQPPQNGQKIWIDTSPRET